MDVLSKIRISGAFNVPHGLTRIEQRPELTNILGVYMSGQNLSVEKLFVTNAEQKNGQLESTLSFHYDGREK